MASQFLPFLSAVFGWIYTLCWSLSFYPQALLNFRRRKTTGSTVDFPFINTLGFLAYFISNAAFYWSPVIRAQYAARNRGHSPSVQPNDIAFAAHAMLLSAITTSQYLLPRAWGFSAPADAARPSRPILGLALGCAAGVLAVVLLVAARGGRGGGGGGDPRSDWCWLDAVYAVSYVKLLITLVKYTPQVVANRRNRSTRGWSIWQVLLDVAGGVLSTAQLALDSWLGGDWSGVTGNPVKFALGNASFVYDAIFVTQHYVLYGDGGGKGAEAEAEAEAAERDALLEDGEGRRGRRLD